MKTPRRYPVATLVLVALLPLACAKKKSSKKDDATAETPEAPAETAPDDASSPQALLGRIALSEITGGTQLNASFAATTEAASAITNAEQAEGAYTSGTPLKFSEGSDTALENQSALGGSRRSRGGYHGSYRKGGRKCSWSFPLLRGLAGAVSHTGSLVFGWASDTGYGYGYGSYGKSSGYGRKGHGGKGYGSCANSGYGKGFVDDYNPTQPPFPFGPGTGYENPSYVWTPSGPVYNNPTLNPLPVTGVTPGQRFDTGIPGCTPSVYDATRGWIASTAPATLNAPLCNGQTPPSGVGPTPGTTYETGTASCVPATYDGTTWRPSGNQSGGSADLCDGNVYSGVTGTGAAVNDQMPSFAPTYTVDGQAVTFRYVGSFDSADHRYYVYGR